MFDKDISFGRRRLIVRYPKSDLKEKKNNEHGEEKDSDVFCIPLYLRFYFLRIPCLVMHPLCCFRFDLFCSLLQLYFFKEGTHRTCLFYRKHFFFSFSFLVFLLPSIFGFVPITDHELLLTGYTCTFSSPAFFKSSIASSFR